MNITRFVENLSSIQNSIYESEFIKKIIDNSVNSPAEQSQFLAQLLQVAINGALELENQDLKNRELKIAEQKTKIELEILVSKARAEVKAAQIAALKELVQSQSMLRSVVDNAKISQANAWVGLMNVFGNATNAAGLTNHTKVVTEILNSINDTPIDAYDEVLRLIQDALKDMMLSDEAGRKVLISALRSEVTLNEVLRIQGFSVFSNAPSKFIIKEQDLPEREVEGKILYFQPSKIGQVEITFSVQSPQGENLSDSVKIFATAPRVNQVPLENT